MNLLSEESMTDPSYTSSFIHLLDALQNALPDDDTFEAANEACAKQLQFESR